MAGKKYEEYAKQVVTSLYEFRNELKNIKDANCKVDADPVYTELGKERLKDGLRKELQELVSSKSDTIKAAVKAFCAEYEVIHSDDGQRYTQEIANALKVIDMCGFSLTKELFREVIEPLKSSYSAMKLIHGVIHSKNNNSSVEEYAGEVLELIDNYMGTNGYIEEYNSALDDIREVQDYPQIVDGTIDGQDGTRYAVLCLSDNMMKVGKLFEELSAKFPHLFKKIQGVV